MSCTDTGPRSVSGLGSGLGRFAAGWEPAGMALSLHPNCATGQLWERSLVRAPVTRKVGSAFPSVEWRFKNNPETC